MNRETEPLNELRIPFSQTHPEGYQNWFDFGRGIQLLINVEYSVRNEPNITAVEVNYFHLHTIYKMLERRLSLQTGNGSGHKIVAFKAKVTHNRPLVNPQTEEMFWSTPPVTHFTGTPKKRPTTVKFIDFQTGWNSNEDFEDNVCLCSEWCNWNAFFYYNPIYRFLLVRHNQLYMEVRGRTTLPNMYLNASVMCGCRAFPGKVPILHLMNDANEYRNKYYEKYYLRKPDFKQHFQTSNPNAPFLDAVSYLRLKNTLDAIKLIHELDDNPFADICIEGLLIYYKVLTDSHTRLSIQQTFVNDSQKWFKVIDLVGRNNYPNFVNLSYVKVMAAYQHRVAYDWLFTTDYEYSSRLVKTDDEIEIKSMRDKVLKRTSIDSPFNIRLLLNNFLNTFASIYKFLSSVEPRLPTARKFEAMVEASFACLVIEKQMDGNYTANDRFNYKIESIVPQFKALEQNFNAFYTLKLYFYLFEIQKHCINSMGNLNKKFRHIMDQVCLKYSFIWRHFIIEEYYLSAYPGQPLFEISSNFEQSFEEFYTIWGLADHERLQIVTNYDYVTSAHFQFQRLYFWWNINGNEENKFKKIVDQFVECLKNTINCSDSVFDNQIMPSLAVLPNSYEYSVEVFDHLVYYTVKANCSVILSSTAKLFKKMHSLQIPNLVTINRCYSLCKPGWVPLFLTMHSVLNTIDSLNNSYITFDDEFERLSNTCRQTKDMVKDIYRHFYTKLSHEWIEEMRGYETYIAQTTAAQLFSLHLAVGQAFIGVFVDDFRVEFYVQRKNCWRFIIEMTTRYPNFIDVRTVFQNYFSDRAVMRDAMPFHSNPYAQHLSTFIGQINNLTATQLRIRL